MSYQALYRKWRPIVFDDVVGQKHITATLKNEIISGKISHSYLFTGIRGTGKTSTAKIFSRAINCLTPKDGNPCNECEICKGILDGSILDVIEIDAASNNGVDNIREIRDEVVYTASRTKYKIYIIDEVHMLSIGAFNALLKTLEEPPKHVIFILATTELHKVPATILSRCQRFDFRRITNSDVVDRLRCVALSDNVKIQETALNLIASLAEGSMRDALSILDRCLAYGQDNLSYVNVVDILGIAEDTLTGSIATAIVQEDASSVMLILDSAICSGKAITQLCESMLKLFRSLLITKLMDNPSSVIDTSPDNMDRLKKFSAQFTREKLVNAIKVLSEAFNNIKFFSNSRIVLELALIKLCMPVYDSSHEALLDRMANIEKKLLDGNLTVTNTRKTVPKTEIVEDIETVNIPAPILEKKQVIKKDFSKSQQDLWPKIVSEIQKVSPSLWGSLDNAIGRIENDVLTISPKDPSLLGILKYIKENKDIIMDVANSSCSFTVKKIIFLEKADDDSHFGKTVDIINKNNNNIVEIID